MPIIKMLSRSNPAAINSTLKYITREANNQKAVPILQNIRSSPTNYKGIVLELLRNEAYRKISRRRVFCYHTIVSLGSGESENNIPRIHEILEFIVKRYLELRGEGVLAYAIPHFDKSNFHYHILESGTLFRSPISSGLRKAELHHLKIELEKFVVENFPQLEYSSVQHGIGKPYTKESLFQLEKRTESERSKLTTLVGQAYSKATTLKQFLDVLLHKGYSHYERSSDGIPTGIVSLSGRKFRFKNLGILPEQIMQLETKKEKDQHQRLMDRLEGIRTQNNIEREL